MPSDIEIGFYEMGIRMAQCRILHSLAMAEGYDENTRRDLDAWQKRNGKRRRAQIIDQLAHAAGVNSRVVYDLLRVVQDRLSALPAALLRRASQALQIADKRLLGTGKSLLTLGELHGIPRRAASAAMWLARRVSAKAVVGLTVGEVRKQLGVKQSITDNDRLVDDRPKTVKHGIDSAAPTCDELRQHADKASWPLEWIELMLTRHRVSLDNAEDFLVSFDCVYCAVLRIARTIEQQGWLHPSLAKVTGRGPRRRAARRARKAVAPWEVEEAAPEGQGAKASRKQKRRPPARE